MRTKHAWTVSSDGLVRRGMMQRYPPPVSKLGLGEKIAVAMLAISEVAPKSWATTVGSW